MGRAATDGFPGPRDAAFHTTRWSTIRAAGAEDSAEARAARELLCRAYWYPLYAYLRRRGESADDAADLVQGFFAAFLERGGLARVEEEGGRFRHYLLAALRHHASHEREKAGALKRGGGARHVPLDPGGGAGLFDADDAEARYAREPATDETPERLYERRFATALLATALAGLREEERERGRGELFERLEPFLQGDPPEGGYAALAAELGQTAGALKVAAHRLRQRWRRRLVEEVAAVVERPQDVEEELRALFLALERP
jgi:RNA polymerase sigma-70 factor (ECF subfamily)